MKIDYTKPWNRAIKANDTEGIKQAGTEARLLDLQIFNMLCSEHGIFAREVREDHLDREDNRHRAMLTCYHRISAERM